MLIYRAPRQFDCCAVSFLGMDLPISDRQAIEILRSPPLNADLLWDFFGRKIVFFARNMTGSPEAFRYRRGARYEEAPSVVDCSTFTWWLYSLMGIELERRSIDQHRQGFPVTLDDVRAGDLIFATGEGHDYWYEEDPDVKIGHVALATGQGTIIHASRPGVTEEDIGVLIDSGRFRDIRRIVPDDSDFYTFRFDPVWNIRSTIDIRWRILQNL